LDAGQLGELLGLSRKAVLNRRSEIRLGQRPSSDLPPVRLLGSRARWMACDVEEWIHEHVRLESDHCAITQAEPGPANPRRMQADADCESHAGCKQ
jgi:predicted DNA-binding transcriptional regulator AlpA